jgi:hypothetical protein
MKAAVMLLGAGLLSFALAAPALAVEDGIIETTSYEPNETFTHAEFERVLTNATESPIDVVPRDLRFPDYPILTVVDMTSGAFDGGIWTVGTLDGGQTATIAYTGDAAPAATTSTTAPTATAPEASTPGTSVATSSTPTGAPATATTPPEELPFTGTQSRLGILAIAGLSLIGLGSALLRAARG